MSQAVLWIGASGSLAGTVDVAEVGASSKEKRFLVHDHQSDQS